MQDDDDDEEMHDQHDQPHDRQIAAAMQPEQQRDIRKGDAGNGDRDDAPSPDLDIGGGFGAYLEQANRAGERPHHADKHPRERIGIDDGKDHEPCGREIADLGAEQGSGDADKHDHRQQLEHEPPHYEWQPEHRLPGPREAEAPLMPRGLGDDIGHRRRWIDRHRELRRLPRMRHARFQRRDRPLDQEEDQKFDGECAGEYQRQLPCGAEQQIGSVGIIRGPQEPVIERLEMRQRMRELGDLARYIADLLGHHQQQLCTEAVSGERNGGRLVRRRHGLWRGRLW